MNSEKHQRKLKEIADKWGVSLATANEIISSQFEFLGYSIRSVRPAEGEYPVYSIKHLGKFLVTKQRQYVLNFKTRRVDNPGYKVFQAPDRVSGNTKKHTSKTIQGESITAG